MEIDWDLQALVRSCATATSLTTSTTDASTMDELFSFLDSVSTTHDQQEDNLLSFSQFSETRSVFEELDQLYKPFSPNYQSISPQTIPISFQGLMEKQQKPQKTPQKQQPHRSKKRKIQQNRVVCQVPKEGLFSDIWAWRKYGQKPIKGSPYPRGYYKCSTSKGCSARKQVERNPSDPEMFIITYTSEHNHSAPTHRNSLAGSTRQKSSKSQPISITDTGSPTSKPSCSSSSSSSISTDLSPMTPLMESMEDELSQQSKQETREDKEEMVAEDDLCIPDMVMNDLFMGLEELAGPSSSTNSITTPIFFDDYFPDNFLANFPQIWLPDNASTAAGGN